MHWRAIGLLLSLAHATLDSAHHLPPDYAPLRSASPAEAEKHEFGAQTNRIMKIMINSIYKNKEVFLRELVSNSADALDKVRFVGLTDKHQLATNPYLNISIVADRAQNTLVIRDSGIGMTREILKANLGMRV